MSACLVASCIDLQGNNRVASSAYSIHLKLAPRSTDGKNSAKKRHRRRERDKLARWFCHQYKPTSPPSRSSTRSTISLIYNLNRSGPKILPYGRPVRICLTDELWFSVLTYCGRWERYDASRPRTEPQKPYFSSLNKSRLLLMVSKAHEKSMKTPNTTLFFLKHQRMYFFRFRRATCVFMFRETQLGVCSYVCHRENSFEFVLPFQDHFKIPGRLKLACNLTGISGRSPFLNKTVTLAFCNRGGNTPDWKPRLKMHVSTGAKISMTCFTELICKSSASQKLLFFIVVKRNNLGTRNRCHVHGMRIRNRKKHTLCSRLLAYHFPLLCRWNNRWWNQTFASHEYFGHLNSFDRSRTTLGVEDKVVNFFPRFVWVAATWFEHFIVVRI